MGVKVSGEGFWGGFLKRFLERVPNRSADQFRELRIELVHFALMVAKSTNFC